MKNINSSNSNTNYCTIDFNNYDTISEFGSTALPFSLPLSWIDYLIEQKAIISYFEKWDTLA